MPKKRSALPCLVPNPDRAIFVSGEINSDLAAKLTPQILTLRNSSQDPITVYIDSEGGSVSAAAIIIGLLKTPGFNGEACPIITVATGSAASAAADMLTLGDYIVAYPHTLLHFHGIRTASEGITVESARDIEIKLLQGNQSAALRMANSVFRRFLSLYTEMSHEIQAVRSENQEILQEFDALLADGTIDLPGFVLALSQHLKPPYDEIALNCLSEAKVMDEIISAYRKAVGDISQLPPCIVEALQQGGEGPEEKVKDRQRGVLLFNLLLASRIKTNCEWSMNPFTLNELGEAFEELQTVADGTFQNGLLDLVLAFSEKLMTKEQLDFFSRYREDDLQNPSVCEELDAIVEPAYAKILPLWTFALLLCRYLNRGENSISPEEAWWLGLIDEVAGTTLYRRPVSPENHSLIRSKIAVGDFERHDR